MRYFLNRHFELFIHCLLLPSLDFICRLFSHHLWWLQTKLSMNLLRFTQPLQGVPNLMYTIVQLGPYGCLAWADIFCTELILLRVIWIRTPQTGPVRGNRRFCVSSVPLVVVYSAQSLAFVWCCYSHLVRGGSSVAEFGIPPNSITSYGSQHHLGWSCS